MTEKLLHAHSGLRYLVLLAGAGAIGWLAWSAIAGRAWGRASRIASAVFTGMLDVQVATGVLLVLLTPYTLAGAVIGHVTLMLLGAVAAHVFGIVNKNRPEGRQSHGLALAGVVVSLALVVLGILSIGRSVV